MKRIWFTIAAAVLLAAPVSQAQPQQNPLVVLNGQFGAVGLAPPPAEAARLAQLMGDALTQLQPQRPGQVDVYLVAAALWGEPVFEREASQAAEILGQRFDLAGRAIVLSAGGQGERRYPAASPDNLSAALGRVGALMDPSEDMLVLFLTSHGTPDGAIGFSEPNRMTASMRPVHLRNLLQQAGLRNRVVIVSACFAGAFIAPLIDDDTIVLAAAAPDRTSFGCRPQNEWTFFGDAFFNRAVREGASLVPAFDQAKVQIERWEREQNLTPPSNPQRFVGARAAARLRRAEAGGR
jgi:Peptidase C13 family